MGGTITYRHLLAWAAFLGGMALLPQLVGPGTLRTVIFANYLAIFAMSWDVLSGRTGYISFGHPFLIGIGAYTTAILSYRFDVPMAVSIWCSAPVTAHRLRFSTATGATSP